MKQNLNILHLLAVIVLAFPILLHSACASNNKKGANDKQADLLEIIYSNADKNGMKVICDFSFKGGDLYGRIPKDSIIRTNKAYIRDYAKKYGKHQSFWGWYVNAEINPIENSDIPQSNFWRDIWKSAVEDCHVVLPNSKVTISPFFILDKNEYRGFHYIEPEEYEEWWYNTLKETGIDIIMLQDSGAEHLSFYTVEDRRPFFEAFYNACEKAGKEFWVNVETGQVEAKDWPEAIDMEKNKNKAWAFTKMDWLKQKLELAAEYGSGIINWGYYPLMNPSKVENNISIEDIDGQDVDLSMREENYEAYKAYAQQVMKSSDGKSTKPLLGGTLWYLPGTIDLSDAKSLDRLVANEFKNYKEVGFEYVWICNAETFFKLSNK